MNASTFISVVALMMSIGCATKSPPMVVAYGRLVKHYDDGIELRVARYEISEIQRGRLPTNVVEVFYWKTTQTNELPRAAILLLSRPISLSPPIWHAVGDDASRGILADTPTDRLRVMSLSDARILDSPQTEWLPRSKAEQIVRDYLRSKGLDLTRSILKLRRAQFCWRASVSFLDEQGRVDYYEGIHIVIRDRGDIINVWEQL